MIGSTKTTFTAARISSSLATVLAIAVSAEAGPRRRVSTTPVSPTSVVAMETPVGSTGSTAQAKADRQAREGVMRHVGGGFGSGTHEGVGFSTISADDAIRRCCYWDQCQPIEIGVARGANGWYACVLYR